VHDRRVRDCRLVQLHLHLHIRSGIVADAPTYVDAPYIRLGGRSMQQGHHVVSTQVRDWRYESVQQEAPKSMLSATPNQGSPNPGGPNPGGTDRQARVSLPPVPQAARTAREFTTAALARWHLDALISDATLIASELVTNAINHGTPESNPGAHVELTWSYQVSRLICVITDQAAGAPVVAAENPEAESGHGLQIVAALAAAWGWTMLGTGEKAVWAALDLPASAIAEAGLAAVGVTPATGPGRPVAGRAADLGHQGPFPATR
jgi:anti-sigma regulatory factor (Ser/Thr protein kinase)